MVKPTRTSSPLHALTTLNDPDFRFQLPPESDVDDAPDRDRNPD